MDSAPTSASFIADMSYNIPGVQGVVLYSVIILHNIRQPVRYNVEVCSARKLPRVKMVIKNDRHIHLSVGYMLKGVDQILVW